MLRDARPQCWAWTADRCILPRRSGDRRRDLRPHRSGAQRSLWKFTEGSARTRRGHHLQARTSRSTTACGASDPTRCSTPSRPCSADAWSDAPVSQTIRGYVARLRVPSGFLIVFVFGWFSRPTVESLWLGLPVAVGGPAGARMGGGVSRQESAARHLGTVCVYAQPALLGTLLVAAGLVIAARSVWLGVLFASVFLFVYLPVIRVGGAAPAPPVSRVRTLRAEVPILWPRFGGSRGNAFRLALYWKNQEYQAALGLLAGALYLVWKVVTA
jgi:hypothetical protein